MLTLLVSLFGIHHYFNNHKADFITKFELILNENSKGKIIFDSISISSINKFPDIEVKVYKLKLIDSLYDIHKRETLFLEELSTSVSIIDAFDEVVKIKTISAKKGHINIFVDDDQYTNTYVFSSKNKKETAPLKFKIIDNDIDILIEDISFTFVEKIKNKRITAHLNSIDFNIDVAKKKISTISLDVLMKEMGLNLEKGTFFNDARCFGSFQPVLNGDSDNLEIPEFDLKIKNQDFKIAALFNIKEHTFSFLLNLEKTHFKETYLLLPENIKSKLNGINIVKPFKVKAKISGKFAYQNKTLVELEYETTNNEIFYKKDSVLVKNVSFNGSFINRVYNEPTIDEPRKNYTLKLKKFIGDYKNIPLELSELTVKNEFSKSLQLETNYNLNGKIEVFNDFLKSDDFQFSNGTFQLQGNYKGAITSSIEILQTIESDIDIRKLVVESKHNKSRFYIPILQLKLNHDNAEIKNFIVRFDKKEKIKISGYIINFGNLLSNDLPKNKTVSSLNFSSDYLNFNSLLKAFGSHKKQNSNNNLFQIKKSINTLAKKFNPHIYFTLKRLDFFEVPLSNININAVYLKNNLNIKNISGNYKDGEANARINIGLKPKKETNNKEVLPLDLSLNVHGKIEHWAEMFHKQNFFFKDANYDLKMTFNDEASSIPEVINKSNLTLNVSEGSMYYKPANLTLPFNQISISLKNKNAFLNDFELSFPNNESLHLKGQINNFIELFEDNISTFSITSFITISSKNINFSDFIDTFNPNPQKAKKQNNIKIILSELYTKYEPSIKLDFEKLSYNNVDLEKVNAHLYFKDSNTLKIEEASSLFYNKKLLLNAEFDISQKTKTNFKTNFSLDDFAIEKLLFTFDNFGYNKLNSPTEVTGIVSLNADVSGNIDDDSGVNYNSLIADFSYEIDKFELKNFQPIIDAGNKIFRKKRFEEIKFSNIINSLQLKNNIITFPETRVQSTAFDFFIEGKLDNTTNTNLWISIPLSNIKRRDLKKVPSNKSFNESGKKIYLEIKADEEGALEHRVHLKNKKQLEIKP